MTPSAGRTAAGNRNSSAAGATRPSSDGPSRIPERTSPMTGGWPIAAAKRPRSRPETTTTASARRTCRPRLTVNALQPLVPGALGLAHTEVEPEKPAARDDQVDADHAGKNHFDVRRYPTRVDYQ